MGHAEEAGQQPPRRFPAAAGPQHAGHPAAPIASVDVDVAADECAISDVDLAVPGDPRERIRVENAARLLADELLVRQLAAAGYDGPVFEVTRNEIASYGVATLMKWMRTGEIAGKCLSHGRPLTDVEYAMRTWTRDDRLEIAVEATARALAYFVEEVLKQDRWDHRRGATLRTYFVGTCLLQYPNSYHRWLTESKRWDAVDLTEPGDSTTAEPGRSDGWSDPTSETVIVRERVRELLAVITDPQTRIAAEMVMLGYGYAAAGEAAGLSEAAVEGRLYRLRKRTA